VLGLEQRAVHPRSLRREGAGRRERGRGLHRHAGGRPGPAGAGAVCSVWKLPDPKLTIQKARGILKPIGVRLTRDSGTKEFIVSPNIATPTWSGSTIADKPIYHTDDLRDAVLTGAAMVFGVGTLAFHEWVDHHGI
jgi:hypothetical protein